VHAPPLTNRVRPRQAFENDFASISHLGLVSPARGVLPPTPGAQVRPMGAPLYQIVASIAPMGSVIARFAAMHQDEAAHALKCPRFLDSTSFLYFCIKERSERLGGGAALRAEMERTDAGRTTRILNSSLLMRFFPMTVDSPEIRAAAVEMSGSLNLTLMALASELMQGGLPLAGDTPESMAERKAATDAAIREFSSVAVRYLQTFRAWEGPDHESIVARAKDALEKLVKAQSQLPPPDEEPMEACRTAFERSVWRLAGQLQSLTSDDAAFSYVAGLREKYNWRHGTPTVGLTRRELFEHLGRAGLMPGQPRDVTREELVRGLGKLEAGDLPALLAEAGHRAEVA